MKNLKPNHTRPNLVNLASLAGLALASVAFAGPRSSVTLTNVPSDIPNNGGGNFSIPSTETYTARYVRIRGTLAEVQTNTFASEATIVLFPNITPAEGRTIVVPSNVAGFTGSISVDKFQRLSTPISITSGFGIGAAALETFDDGAGPDSTWTSLTVTLNDGPPAVVADFGLIGRPVTYGVSVTPNVFRWVRFSVNAAVDAALNTYLDIDTEGSALNGPSGTPNDTYIALYNEDGVLIAQDDDNGSVNLSQLTFGVGTRPAVGSGSTYNGRNGPLAPGVYYLGVGGYSGSRTVDTGWDFSTTGGDRSGGIRINIRTNANNQPYCTGDYNKSGSVGAQDIFDFLTDWFAPCF